MLFIYLALSCVFATAAAEISENCLDCICKLAGCESYIGRCRTDNKSEFCGPFSITEGFWIGCGSPGAGWRSCTQQMDCSRACVKAFMRLYGESCTGSYSPTCEQYARIHAGGPKGCQMSSTIDFGRDVARCCCC